MIALALCVPSAATAEWHEASSRHFVVYSEDSPDKVKAFTESLERYDKALRVLRSVPDGITPPARRVTIYLVDDVGDIRRLAGKGAKDVAGFYIPRAEGSVAFVPRNTGGIISARTILLHEYAHDFMLTNWAGAAFPVWFVEGFAEFHSTAIFREDGAVIFGASPEHRRFSIGNAAGLPVKQLLKAKIPDLDREQVGILYARGWLLTHYLTFDPDRRKQLAAYIGAINAGKSSDDAAAAFPGLDDMALNAYGKRPRLPSSLIPADQLDVGEISMRALGHGEAAVMSARILSQRGVDKDTAPGVAELARKLAAPFPNDPFAQAELAEAEFDAGNYEAAEAAADRALAANPKHMNALIYKGMILGGRAKASGDAALWKEARRWYLAANKLDPEDPEPLVRYYESFVGEGAVPTKNAVDALLYAHALAPQDLNLRMTAGQVLLERGDAAAARAAISPVAYAAHGGGSASPAQKILTALDADGPEKALEVLKGLEEEAKKEAEAAEKRAS